MQAGAEREILQVFAGLTGYPKGDLAEAADRGVALLQGDFPVAAGALERFRCRVQEQSALRLGEIYTAAFDLHPRCAPYIAWQLCGESPQRTLFLLHLRQLYRQHGFVAGAELPDHLAEILGFLAQAEDDPLREELVTEALQPALEKMLAAFDGDDHPYQALLQALRDYLGAVFGEKDVPKKETTP